MDVRPLSITGAWVFSPRQFSDDRGLFLEWYKAEALEQAVGHRLTLAQANHSISRRGVLRGVHYADLPPGQAKYVSTPRGAVLDIVVDIRVGSPTFGQHECVRLDEVNRRCLYLAEGLGHAFLALADDTAVSYLCSTPHTPSREHALHPLDPALGIHWPAGLAPLLSPRDDESPSLAHAAEQGLLPSYEECLAYYSGLARPSGQ